MLGNNAFKARLVLSNKPHSRHENEDVPTLGAMVHLAAGFYISESPVLCQISTWKSGSIFLDKKLM